MFTAKVVQYIKIYWRHFRHITVYVNGRFITYTVKNKSNCYKTKSIKEIFFNAAFLIVTHYDINNNIPPRAYIINNL